ncbi:hypothetical protein HQO44_12225 [Rhodococcus fascians]|nr:hypothetical protein [Rhodococcus fascians]
MPKVFLEEFRRDVITVAGKVAVDSNANATSITPHTKIIADYARTTSRFN